MDGVFEGHRGLEVQGAVEPHGVVEGFDVVKDHGSCLGSGAWHSGAKAFGLQRCPERLHGGVVVAVGTAAHAGGDAAQLQTFAELGAGVLAATVAVVQQAFGG